jgi:hypothetical protein
LALKQQNKWNFILDTQELNILKVPLINKFMTL